MLKIADERILSIPIQENNESFVDLKKQSVLRFGPPPECPETAPHYTIIRKTVYEKLCRVQNKLPFGWLIRVYEGFRSLEVQQFLFSNQYERVKQKYPFLDHQDIFLETTRLVSPVTNIDGSMNIPPHNTGGAIDVEIVDSNGRLIDMGMAAADWNIVSPELCLSECDTLPITVKNNRKILLDTMQALDFVNYPYEWWHFSYGDRVWAYYKNKACAIYGSVTNETLFNNLDVTISA